MFKLLFYLNILICIRGRFMENRLEDDTLSPNLRIPLPTYQNDVLIDNEIATVAEAANAKNMSDKNAKNWQGLWFPHPPNYQNDVKPTIAFVPKTKVNEGSSNINYTTDWAGPWFPFPPKYDGNNAAFSNKINKLVCDDGKYNIKIDFDPEDKRHSFNYLCIGNRTEYAPNLNISALLKISVIPPAYEPPERCVNESIDYIEQVPTFGAYRPLAPIFGSYQFLPPQRWLHSLADGAIVLLYHPCAFPGQIKLLQNTLKGCLYRHIITPSNLLTPQRPLALLAWGKSLQMSVVDDDIVVKFIKDNAKMGLGRKKLKLKMNPKAYNAGLLDEAHLVTDDQDTEICGYKEMR